MEATVISASEGFIGTGLCDHLLARGVCAHLHVPCNSTFEAISKTAITVNAYLKYSSRYALLLNSSQCVLPQELSETIQYPTSFLHFLESLRICFTSIEALHTIPEAVQTLRVTWRLLEKTVGNANSDQNMVLLSSRAVYGTPSYLPVDEKHPLKPRTFYGLLKLLQEYMYMYFSSEYGVANSILRISDVYGPMRKRTGRYLGTVPYFILNALNNAKIELNGNGLFRRDFLYSEDLFRIIEMVMVHKVRNGPINVGSFNSVPILTVAELIASHVGNVEISLNEKSLENSFSFDLTSSLHCDLFYNFPFTLIDRGIPKTFSESNL